MNLLLVMILKEIGYTMCNFIKTNFEDLKLETFVNLHPHNTLVSSTQLQLCACLLLSICTG